MKRAMPGAPNGVNTGSPAAPAARYSIMLAAPTLGPSIMPARMTSIGCNVIGTGVPGSGRAICDAAATAAANNTAPNTRSDAKTRRAFSRLETSVVDMSVDMSVDSRNAERHGIAAAETQRGEPGGLVAILERVKQRGEDARAARANRMTEGDRAAVHVHAIPIPRQALPVRNRLRRERFVRFDEIVISDRRAGALHQVLHGVNRGEEEILRLGRAGRIRVDARENRETVRARVLLGRHDERRCAVVEARRIAGRHRQRFVLVLARKRGTQLRERFGRRVLARAFIGVDRRGSL